MTIPDTIADVEQLEDLLSTPTQLALETIKKTAGDFLVLGAGGKMGPTLARMLRRGIDAVAPSRRVIGVSRFASGSEATRLRDFGVETVSADLLDLDRLSDLPDADNVIYMAGMKFGSTGREATTWAVNSFLPGAICRRYHFSHIVAFSTGNVYALTPVNRGGSRETECPQPQGEYAMSCLGRERVLEYFSRTLNLPISILRLNYATELRYGVLVDIARHVLAGEAIDLGMGYVNVIWQGDANAMAIASLAHAATPPFVVNVAGPETLSVREIAMEMGRLLDRPPRFTGDESPTALLSNGQHGHRLFGYPRVGAGQLIRWTADWVRRGGAQHNKPTHFEARDGKFEKLTESSMLDSRVAQVLSRGVVIPAHPLALTAARKLDERRQRALTRYYIAAGAGGVAVGVHTTQFAIREPKFGLFDPVLALAAEEMDRAEPGRSQPLVRVGGICGKTAQAIKEAGRLRELRYHAGLLSLAAMKTEGDDELVSHCRAIGQIIPLIGFYLQPSVGGRVLPYSFWRKMLELPAVVAVKIAPFNRYQTLDVVRAVVESGRHDVALYTGNDDNIVADLLTPYRFGGKKRIIVGGLLGHWAVNTRRAFNLLQTCHLAACDGNITAELLRLGIEVTDANAAYFDPSHGFAGCIAGLHEVLRRQGLLEGIWCLDEREGLSPGQVEAIDRVMNAYPHLHDDEFIAENRDEWLR